MKLDILNNHTKKMQSLIAVGLVVVAIAVGGFLLSGSDDSSEENGVNIENTSEIFQEIITELNSWTGDYLIQGCESGGNLETWSCNVFSPEKSQTRIAIWKNDEVELSGGVTMDETFTELTLLKPSFNDLESVITAQKALETAESSGLNQDNILQVSIGENTIRQFEDRYVWQIVERSRDEVDEDGVAELIETYYVDAENGKLIR